MSVSKNFLYSSIITVSGYIISFVTFPYITRTLGVENLGIYSYVDNIVNFFILFSSLGIGILGVREISKCSDGESTSNVFSSLFILNLITTVVVLLIFIVCIYAIPRFAEMKAMLWIGSFKILSSVFLIEWFFAGKENFKFIAIRGLVLKIIYAFSILIFVTDQNDYIIYYFLTVCLLIINAGINWKYASRFVKLKVRNIKIYDYVKPYARFGLYLILTSLYTTFNVIYLGSVSTKKEVGYYTTALTIYSIFLAFFSSLTRVLLPRISALSVESNHTKITQLINISFEILSLVFLPLIFVLVGISEEVIAVIAGAEYEKAVPSFQIMMPLLFIVGISQILITQLLMPLKYDKIIVRNSVIGASLGILLNIAIVPMYASYGTAVVLLASEIVVCVLSIVYVHNNISIPIPYTCIAKITLLTAPLIFIGSLFKVFFDNNIAIILSSMGVAACYVWFISVKILKSELAFLVVQKIKFRT